MTRIIAPSRPPILTPEYLSRAIARMLPTRCVRALDNRDLSDNHLQCLAISLGPVMRPTLKARTRLPIHAFAAIDCTAYRTQRYHIY